MKLASSLADARPLALFTKVFGLVLVTTSGAFAGQETFKLLPNDGATSDWFGFSAAISGGTATVGAILDDDNGGDSGSAYLFDVSTGQQTWKLLPGDGASGDWFGFSVAISDGTVIVGAPLDEHSGLVSGSAYLFDAATGQQISKLLPSDGAAGDWFGRFVAISGSTAIVGACFDDDNGAGSGSAYLFDVSTGQQTWKLLPGDGATSDVFGWSVAISDGTAIVGAPRDDDNGLESGSAYLFDVSTGQQISKLLPGDGAVDDRFGWSVAISGNTAIVGAKFDSDNGIYSGSAYLFDVSTGQQIAKLLPSDGAFVDHFGISVSISNSTAIVGASGDDDNGYESGSAYLFDVNTGQQISKLLPGDGATDDRFGWSVAISGSTAIMGANIDDDNGDDSGSAYLFDVSAAPNYCTAAVNSSGAPAAISASGTLVVADNDFTLLASDLPIGEPGYFLMSASMDFVQGFGGSAGNLCLGAPIIRINQSGQVLNSGMAGMVELDLDLSALPQGAVFLPGDTWYFQLWFRDGLTSNTTDGIEVMFR